MATNPPVNPPLATEAQSLAMRAVDEVDELADCLKAYTAIEQLMNPSASRLGLSGVERAHLFFLLSAVNTAVLLQLRATVAAARNSVACAYGRAEISNTTNP